MIDCSLFLLIKVAYLLFTRLQFRHCYASLIYFILIFLSENREMDFLYQICCYCCLTVFSVHFLVDSKAVCI